MPEIFQPPSPTYSGGVAVQSAVEPDGTQWQYDNAANKWVNLKSGEGLAPQDFAARASGSRNSADYTKALANAMRQEEAQLTAPLRQPVMPPTPSVQPPPIAPVTYSPQDMARVQAQAPVPSTQNPPTEQAWQQAVGRDPAGASRFFQAQGLMQNYDYNQKLQRLISGGMDYGQALSKLGPPPFSSGGRASTPPVKRYNVHGVGLVDEAGNVVAPAPKPPPKDTTERYNYAEFTASQKREADLRKELAKATDLDVKSQLVGAIAREVATQKKLRPAQATAAPSPVTAPTPEPKRLDQNTAKQFLAQAKGDKEKARKLARDAGYEF